MQTISNPHRKSKPLLHQTPMPSIDASAVAVLLMQCPKHAPTPLRQVPALASAADVAQVWVKDERERMGLGSFKALGAAYVIACDAVASGNDNLSTALEGRTYVTASAGNHGMSVAAGAAVFGANAVIFIAETVPESFARRLSAKGAQVERAGQDYAQSMEAAQAAAQANGWALLSDSSWPGYLDAPFRLMEGYLQLADEAIREMPDIPTHVFLQAGVGGLACAVAALVRARWDDAPRIIVVEPEHAPALQASIQAGKVVFADGPESQMGRLDCKEPSMIALQGLAHHADDFATITEAESDGPLPLLTAEGLDSTASGAAGIAGLMAAGRTCGLTAESRVLCILSEGPDA